MRGLNKVIVIGNLGMDPEVRQIASGSVANLSVATTEKWKDKTTGEQRDATEWHRVAIFGPLADVAAQYLRKGSKVYLEGRLRTRKWQGQDGQDHYTTEIVLSGPGAQMLMLDTPRDATSSQHAAARAYAQASGAVDPQRAAASQAHQTPPQQSFDDDIPF